MQYDYVIGFTGTRKGMTIDQKITINSLLHELVYDANSLSHEMIRLYGNQGQCVGADEEFHAMCHKLDIACHGWPASDVDSKWISRNTYPSDILHPAKPALMRNKDDIVGRSKRIIAAPATDSYSTMPFVRGGTWSTIVYTRTKTTNKILYLVPPSGVLHREVTG